ncbi:BTAD domain-containing putative transcriptional regulator [Amycolatopsis sp. WGS_07]|uniref:nSTAND1 domain-containing NTPase n=1 Tax=Amycolatopsis sp. WGS_07 TaxID=3076764 RepID=UPI003872EF84
MDFRLLGPVELWVGDRRVDLGTSKQRCVLAALLLGAGSAQPIESLIDRVWGEAPPTQVRTALYSYISRARRALRDASSELTIAQEPGGYLLDLPRDLVDVHRFETLCGKGFRVTEPDERVAMLDRALGLWRGQPLQDLSGRWVDEVRQRLGRERVRVCAEWASVMLELGRHSEAGDRLERALLDHPLAEPLVGQLMVSLHLQGRQAEALDCFAGLRARLADELGVEPGPAIGDLHLRILRGQPVGTRTEPPITPVARTAPDEAPPRRPPVRAVAVEAPYLGLETFQQADAARFFGRQSMVEEMLARLADRRFLAVFGPSGSGKSSLLRAGLLPALADWDTVLCTPGEHPLAALSAKLVAAGVLPSSVLGELTVDPACLSVLLRYRGGEQRRMPVVLVVDQFEEVFSLCRDEHERSQFVEALVSLADTPSTPARVVIGIRADFYPACAEFPALVALLRDQQLLVGPMAEAELREVITGPAALAGLTAEPALVDAALADVLGEPGALPMLSHALRETWLRREDDRLTVGAYWAAGGVRAAVAQTADEIYQGFDTRQAALAREIFLRLTAPGEGAADTRRRPRREELLDMTDADEVTAVLATLAEARLITVDEGTVTVAHESLIRGWPKLRGWLDEDREYLRARQRLTDAAQEWAQHGRDEDLVYSASRLAAWRERDPGKLTDLERDFLAAGERRTLRAQLTRRRRVQATLIGLSAALVALLVLSGVAVVQADRAREERDRALSGSLVADARNQLPLDPELALLLARRAYETTQDGQTESALTQAVVSSRVRAAFTGHEGPVTSTTFSPDGKRLVSGGADDTVRSWPLDGSPPAVILRSRNEIVDLACSEDGTGIAAADAGGAVWLGARALGQVRPGVLAVAIDADKRVLAAARDGSLWTFTVDGRSTSVPGLGRALTVAAFSPDRRRVAGASPDGRVWRWDQGTGAVIPLRGPDVEVTSLAVGPDGATVAGGRADGREEVWRDGRPPLVLYPNRDRIQALAFSHDGKALLSGGRDRTSHYWQLTARRDFIAFRGQGGPIRDVALSRDDELVATAAADGTVRLWEPAPRPEHRVLEGHTGSVLDVMFSEDGTKVVSGGTDGTVVVAASDGTGKPVVLRGHHGPVDGVAFSNDSRFVASAGDDGQFRVWPSGGGDAIATYTGQGVAWAVAFSPDGHFLAGASEDGAVRRWRLGSDAPPEVLRDGQAPVHDVVFSRDGWLVAAVDNGTVRLWPPSGRPTTLRGADGMRSVAITHDGQYVAGAGNDGAVRVWRRSDGALLATLVGHYGLVFSLSFNGDGAYLASVGNDKKVRVWNWARWRDPVVFDDYNTTVQSVAFGQGDRIAVGRGDTNSTVDVWRCRFCLPAERFGELADLARARSTRELTAAERDRYLGP